MYAVYYFDFLATITEQLEKHLNHLGVTPLTTTSLDELNRFQQEHDARQGVSLLVYEKTAVYVGKANNVKARLAQHLRKMEGRRNLDIKKAGFKCLLLDKSMSTSANEDLLMERFRGKGQCEWNGSGFGAKYPGKERDTTAPNDFDNQYPINDEWVCEDIADEETVGSLLAKLKKGLPYLFRYKIDGDEEGMTLNLKGIDRRANTLLRAAAEALGDDWQATRFKSHLILYKKRFDYRYGDTLYPK